MILQEVCLQLTGEPSLPARQVAKSLRDALADRLEGACRQTLSVGPGVCVSRPYPNPDSPTGLSSIGTYEDLFAYRDWADHLNGHHGPAKPDDEPDHWWYHCYIHLGFESTDSLGLPVERLEGGRLDENIQITDSDTQLVNLDELDYPRLASADAHTIEFHSPYIISSTVEGVTHISVDSWLAEADELRRRAIHVDIDDTSAELVAIDAGQRSTYDGTSPIAVAKMGLIGMGGHTEVGFGGARIRPALPEGVEVHHTAQPTGGTQ